MCLTWSNFNNTSTVPLSYADIVEDPREEEQGKRSYKETVIGISAGSGTTVENNGKESDNGTTHVGQDQSFGGMELENIEKKHGKYECPEIVITPNTEARLCRPWKQGLIVKLLGRKIGFKAHETRLNQLWVKKGAMNIIDLGCDFFLVYLSCPEDHEKALTNDPCLIYDHYLIVREWKPNFRLENEDTIVTNV